MLATDLLVLLQYAVETQGADRRDAAGLGTGQLLPLNMPVTIGKAARNDWLPQDLAGTLMHWQT